VDPGSAPPAANARASPVATARYPWAALIARLFLTLPLVCPRCGADMRIRAFITQAAPPGLHLEPILAAARVGKPVLTEKPLAANPAQALTLAALD